MRRSCRAAHIPEVAASISTSLTVDLADLQTALHNLEHFPPLATVSMLACLAALVHVPAPHGIGECTCLAALVHVPCGIGARALLHWWVCLPPMSSVSVRALCCESG